MSKTLADQFETYRPLLFGLAYRMLGTVVEAEDIVQDVYLRAREVPAAQVQNAKAYLRQLPPALA